MKTFYSKPAQFSFLLLTPLFLAAGMVRAQPTDWEIDSEHFSIAFEAGHIGYQKQLGLFLEGSGSFRFDPETQELISGRVEIQADSIFTNLKARDKHLRGKDFLNAKKNPVILFEATDYAPGTLTGNLTLLGETHPVVLEVIINKQAKYPFGHRRETLGISAHTTITRSQWGMNYGVTGNLVGDEVRLRFEFEAMRD
tara:strand:- start:20355 stop:20945 length:591 start_codon:yes stop_codon:yes gene_type:complete